MDKLAMCLGYALMAATGIAAAGALLGMALTFIWRKLAKDAPSLAYLSEAVKAYNAVQARKKLDRDACVTVSSTAANTEDSSA